MKNLQSMSSRMVTHLGACFLCHSMPFGILRWSRLMSLRDGHGRTLCFDCFSAAAVLMAGKTAGVFDPSPSTAGAGARATGKETATRCWNMWISQVLVSSLRQCVSIGMPISLDATCLHGSTETRQAKLATHRLVQN